MEYPQYSRPAEWHGQQVPEVLLSGDHEKVRRWRRKQYILRTLRRRPDMFRPEDFQGSKQDRKLLAEAMEEFSAQTAGEDGPS